MLCNMPHSYRVLQKCDEDDWTTLENGHYEHCLRTISLVNLFIAPKEQCSILWTTGSVQKENHSSNIKSKVSVMTYHIYLFEAMYENCTKNSKKVSKTIVLRYGRFCIFIDGGKQPSIAKDLACFKSRLLLQMEADRHSHLLHL